MKSGIYKIINLADGKIYVGSAVHIKNRWATHIANLNNNNHPNRHLQNAWNLFGKECFKFEVLEYCDNISLIHREQYHIDISDCYTKGYNLNPKAGSNLGFKYSESSKAKMSLWQIGRKMSSEAKQNMRNAQRRNSKWPHDDGLFCKCSDCSNIRREYKKLKAREYRKKPDVYLENHKQITFS